MEITYFMTTLLLWILAIFIGSGHANFLIAGYNTASKEEKAKIDEKALGKFMGKFLFVLGLIQCIVPTLKILGFDNTEFSIILTSTIFITVTIVGVVYANTGDRFKK